MKLPGIPALPAPVVSPSARRAWIEISELNKNHRTPLSPSARRAWIEMSNTPPHMTMMLVALRTEGVD